MGDSIKILKNVNPQEREHAIINASLLVVGMEDSIKASKNANLQILKHAL